MMTTKYVELNRTTQIFCARINFHTMCKIKSHKHFEYSGSEIFVFYGIMHH